MIDLNVVAGEVFNILRSYDYTVHLYDDEGNAVMEPDQARRMFAAPANLLVSITDNGDNSAIRLYLGKRTKVSSVMGLVTTLRMSAVKHNLLFNMRRYGREIEPKDFATKHAVTEAKHMDMNMIDLTEGMYGTSRSSYLKLPRARMIVRHNDRIDAEVPGSRGRKVESVFCENHQGERFKMPTNSLAAGRAMTQHMSKGGEFGDDIGKAITEMAEESARLGHAARHVTQHRANLKEAAMKLREMCRGRMQENRRMFERLYRPSTYENAAKELAERGHVLIEDGGESAVTPEMLEEMRGMLEVDGADRLPEDVLEACARCRMSGERKGLGEAPGPKPKGTDIPMISVLGRKVNEVAWNDLKAGKIELVKEPSIPPAGGDQMSGMLLRLRAVANVCADDSLGNLLSFVATELEEPRENRAVLRAVAAAAIRAAGMMPSESKAMKEFIEWLRIDADPLMESNFPDDYPWGAVRRQEEDEARYEEVVDDIVGNFDVDEFLESDHGGDDSFGWNSRADLSDEEKSFTREEVVKAIRHYLEHQIENDHELSVGDLRSEAEALAPKVIEAMVEAGYTEEGGSMMAAESIFGEDEELTREDVLLPSGDMLDDLKGEVKGESGSKDGPEMTADAVARMRQLAGIATH